MADLLGSAVHGRLFHCLVLGALFCAFAPTKLYASDQRGTAMSTPVETFKASDVPQSVTVRDRSFSTPYGYGKAANANRKYPLVVIGKWGEGNAYFDAEIRKRYPSFYVKFPFDKEADGVLLAEVIDAALESGLRIDVNRILYTGFSAGGSGSFRLARGFASRGKYFAGINRIAGQSQDVLVESAVGRTAIWLHQGLKDAPRRVSVSRKLYENLKKHPVNSAAIETKSSDTVTWDGEEHPRTTWVLTKDNVEVARYSEYPTRGHDKWLGYSDPGMFRWIFGRAIRAGQTVEAEPGGAIAPAKTE